MTAKMMKKWSPKAMRKQQRVKKCACAACANPRKVEKGQWKLTPQERKAPKA